MAIENMLIENMAFEQRLRSTTSHMRAPAWLALFVAAAAAAMLQLPAAAADIYRVENPDGTVTYTDRPPEGAKGTRMSVETVNEYKPERVPYEGTEADRATTVAAVGYEAITITSPAPEATFHSNEGNVPLTFTIKPPLRAGDSVRVLVDGSAHGIGMGADGLGQLTGIERGAHTLVVEVLDANRRTQATSSPVTFYVHKTSVLLGPNARPNGPARRPAGAVLRPPPPKQP